MRYIMIQRENVTKRSDVWPVVFPEEKLTIKRPSLRYICQDNPNLGELLSYFLYEAGLEAKKQGAEPLMVSVVVLYRTHKEMLYGIDNSTSRRVLIQNIEKLGQIGFIEAFSY